MSRRRGERVDRLLLSLSDFRKRQAEAEKLQRGTTRRKRRATRMLGRPTLCECGSRRAPTMCHGCTIALHLATLERRITDDGREQVRISGNITWGKLPSEIKGPALVCPDVTSEWQDSDSEDGRRLVAARHPSRPAKRHGRRDANG